jgi:hypothetical protein
MSVRLHCTRPTQGLLPIRNSKCKGYSYSAESAVLDGFSGLERVLDLVVRALPELLAILPS